MKIVSQELYRGVWPECPDDEVVFLTKEEMLANPQVMADADIVNVQPFMITRDFLDMCENVRWISSPASGYDSADVEAMRERGITFTNGRGVMATSIAEDAMCKMLAMSRRIPEYLEAKKRHEWISFGVDPWMVNVLKDLLGKTLGILGVGRIAQELAPRANAFGMHVIAWGEHVPDPCPWERTVHGADGLDELLSASDYVMIACGLNERTYHLFDAKAFDEMKPGSYLVNSGRGAIVCADDLADALRSGKLAGAALDVFEQEPLPADSELWDVPNLIITTHKAGGGDSWVGHLRELYRENLLAFKAGEPMKNVVC